MEVHDKTSRDTKPAIEPLSPKSLDLIDRIFYFEQLVPTADNDNSKAATDSKGSACFESWALPDYMRS